MAIGRAGLVDSAYLRLFLVLGSLVGLGLAVTGLAGGTRRDAPMVTLATLGIAGLTLTLADPRARGRGGDRRRAVRRLADARPG